MTQRDTLIQIQRHALLIARAKDTRPGHCDYLTKSEMARIAERIASLCERSLTPPQPQPDALSAFLSDLLINSAELARDLS
jgi:hypothetical protein